jgi:hypothetical protein
MLYSNNRQGRMHVRLGIEGGIRRGVSIVGGEYQRAYIEELGV